MDIEIEKDIPVAKSKSQKYIEAFTKMGDGDSFKLPFSDDSDLAKIRSMLQNAAIKASVKIATRTYDNSYIRVWRVEEK